MKDDDEGAAALTRREALLPGGALLGGALSPSPAGAAPASAPSELCFKSAVELAGLIQKREITATEVLNAHLLQIERVNPKVNAIVTLVAEAAREQAERADLALRRNEPLGPLHGLPIAIKDLVATKGIRTTFGSRIYKDFVPEQDDLVAERIRAAGAVILGKSNAPEFGAGSQTFNEVFGETHNPWDLTKTCGGSSGGGAVALACGMTPIADGSDMGGSLRNPPSFCNVVGLRPSPGRVPDWPENLAWQTLSVSGPMGRSAEDVALLLSALAGPDPRCPIALDEPGEVFRRPLARSFKGSRVAWSRNLGRYPVEPRVNAVCDGVRGVFAELGCTVEDAEPDFKDADEIFQTLRAWQYALGHEAHLRDRKSVV